MREFSARKPNRLRSYDYSTNGAYFLTICVKDRAEILGRIENGQIILDEYGKIVVQEMVSSCELRKECKIDQYVIMPNHIHLILLVQHIVGADGNPPITPNLPITPNPYMRYSTFTPTQNQSVPSFVRGFKGATSRILGFSIWQRSFHDHIIRDENDYTRLAQYIENNPANWENDCFHPTKLISIEKSEEVIL
ncbi:MAG: hypothetical protein FWG71_03805 [Synergistaceae bacterium]|nr:hypothetical protein [Synergistaceae bacterium]